jgi:hypothetical protein
MLYLLHLNKNSNRKNMPKLGFPNYFIVNKVKQNVAQTLQSKICVIWWLRQLDASMRFWVQTHVIHVHEFLYLVMYTMHILVYVCAYDVKRA